MAVLANQPQILAGSLDSDGADKGAHFVTVADSFHIPLVFLADNPGVMPGSQSERQAILRSRPHVRGADAGPRAQVHRHPAQGPGFGSMVMGMIPFDGQSATFAYPGATMGAMGAAAMSRARGSDLDEATLLRQMEVEASFRSAESFGQDELISPVETRDRLLHALERGLYRRQATPEPRRTTIAITP